MREVSLGEAVQVAVGVTVTPVIETVVTADSAGDGRVFFAMKAPLGCILITPAGRRAFTVAGEEVDPERLKESFPGLP